MPDDDAGASEILQNDPSSVQKLSAVCPLEAASNFNCSTNQQGSMIVREKMVLCIRWYLAGGLVILMGG